MSAEPGLAPAAAAAGASVLERAQAIRCNGLAVAVPYRHARSVIEDEAMSPVPNAPPWLAGAANIEGHIVPVVDLHAWVDPARPRPAGRSRLLLCGDGDERLALRFEGLPQMVQLQPRGAAEGAAPAVPAPLQPYHRAWAAASAPEAAALSGGGGANSASGAAAPLWWPVIDVAALTRTWAHQVAAAAA